MIILYLLIILMYDVQNSYTRSTENNVDLPNYDDSTVNLDLEKQLRSKITEKRKSEERLRHLKERIGNDTEYSDEIPHFVVKNNRKGKHFVIEKAFRKVIGMVGVKYNYKRDSYWRTWREVNYSKKRKEVICYRCQNIINANETNCTHCHYGGFWVIEEKHPPCSYEIISYKNNGGLCVGHFWQLNKANRNTCPTVMPYNEISSCDLPIVTNYLVTVDYSKNVSERSLGAFCQGRQQCEFSTVYIVNPESIVFRIINTTNDIIYSRIMKPGNKNYACVSNCGKFDFGAMSAKRNEDHLVLNLLQPSKKKRDNTRPKKHRQGKKKSKKNPPEVIALDSKMGVLDENILIEEKPKYPVLEQPLDRVLETTKAPSMCKQILLRELLQDLRDENYLFEK